jgi:hypothetical protein
MSQAAGGTLVRPGAGHGFGRQIILVFSSAFMLLERGKRDGHVRGVRGGATMMADMEKDLGKFIGEQNPFAQEMRLPPHWQTDEAVVSFPSVADFWAKLMQDLTSAVSKVIRIKYTVEGQPEQKTYSLYLAYASEEE